MDAPFAVILMFRRVNPFALYLLYLMVLAWTLPFHGFNMLIDLLANRLQVRTLSPDFSPKPPMCMASGQLDSSNWLSSKPSPARAQPIHLVFGRPFTALDSLLKNAPDPCHTPLPLNSTSHNHSTSARLNFLLLLLYSFQPQGLCICSSFCREYVSYLLYISWLPFP